MEEHREPWEVISLITAVYLGVFMIHCVSVFLEYAVVVVNHKDFNLGEFVEIPLLL
jgi:hypothetical protein